MLFLLEHPLGSRQTNRKERHKSDHQPHQCWQPSRHHSGKGASRSGVDLAQELELVLAEVLEAQGSAEVWVLEEMAALVSELVAVEDPRLASHTCLPCTSFPFHIEDQDCTSSRTGDKECHTVHVLHVFQSGSQLGTQHLTLRTWLHR